MFEWVNENATNDAVVIYMTDGGGESVLTVSPKHQGTLWLLTTKKEYLSVSKENLPKNSRVISFTNN